MNELEIIQPEENLESGEAVENAEGQAMQDTTHEPGARIEQTQDFAQAEAVESALGDAMNTAEQAGVTPVPIPIPKPAGGDAPAGELSTPCPDPEDLPEGSGTVEIKYSPNPGGAGDDSGWLGTGDDDGLPDMQITEDLGEPAPAGVVEIPEGSEFKPAGEDDGTVDRDDHPVVKDPELSAAPGTPGGDEYYIDATGVIRSEDEEDDGGEKHGISDEPAEPLPLEPPDPDPA